MLPRQSARWKWALATAALVVIARLPFLLAGASFFDSDDAIEGLMARHVLGGEFPLFFWGQSYKGTPEVYLDAAAFWLFGSGVLQLQSVTLMLFAAFAALQFVMLDAVASRPIALLASLLVIACPPALVLWSLRGTAEITLTLLIGAGLILAAEQLRTTRQLRWLAAAAFLTGAGLWVQQFILYYVVALVAAATLLDAPWRAQHGWPSVRHTFAARDWAHVGPALFFVAAAIYALLAAYAFAGGAVHIEVGALNISATHPQKLIAITALLGVVWAGLSWLAPLDGRRGRMRALAVATSAFAAGASPMLFSGGSSGVPIGRMTASELRDALPILTAGVVPVLSGFRLPDTSALRVTPLWAVPIIVAIAASFWTVGRHRSTAFFHVLAASIIAVFLASGTLVDMQSYRYLMPLHAALPAILAMGIVAVWRGSRALGILLCGTLIAWSALTQALWYRSLQPDQTTPMLIACLDNRGVTRAYAGYWRSYKMTFLAREHIIVAPTDGLDRYTKYSMLVAQQPGAPTLDDGYVAGCASAAK